MLGTDWHHFKIVRIRDVRAYPSDHFALRARLLIYPTEAGHHCSADGLPAQIGSVHGGKEDSRS